jgi:hypothetical protein
MVCKTRLFFYREGQICWYCLCCIQRATDLYFQNTFMYLKIWYHCRCGYQTHISIIPASHHGSLDMIPGQCLWDSWWTKWHWERFLFRVFRFLLISMIQQTLHSHTFLSTAVVLVYHTVSSMPGWRRQLLWTVVRCAHAYQLPLQLNLPVKTDFGYHLGCVCYSHWYSFKIDHSFETNLGYCLGCHCAVVGGT